MTKAQMLISGILVCGYAVIALFFLKFWSKSRDRLFGFFAAAFGLLAVQRLLLALLEETRGTTLVLYGLRAFAFLIIIFAILDKNRASDR